MAASIVATTKELEAGDSEVVEGEVVEDPEEPVEQERLHKRSVSGGEEPVGPLLGEPARVGEDDLDLGVADLQAGQDVGELAHRHMWGGE